MVWSVRILIVQFYQRIEDIYPYNAQDSLKKSNTLSNEVYEHPGSLLFAAMLRATLKR